MGETSQNTRHGDLEFPTYPPTWRCPLKKSQRKAQLIRRRWRRVREKRIRASLKAYLRYLKGGGDVNA